MNGIQHPIPLPIFLWRPERVSGIPSWRESRPLAADRPMARFHENEKPYFLPIAILSPFDFLSYSFSSHPTTIPFSTVIRSP